MNIEQKQYIGNSAAGIVAGTSVAVCVPRVLMTTYINKFNKHVKNIQPQKHLEYWNASQKAFNNLEIKDKVTIVDINESNWEPIADDLVKKKKRKN